MCDAIPFQNPTPAARAQFEYVQIIHAKQKQIEKKSSETQSTMRFLYTSYISIAAVWRYRCSQGFGRSEKRCLHNETMYRFKDLQIQVWTDKSLHRRKKQNVLLDNQTWSATEPEGRTH